MNGCARWSSNLETHVQDTHRHTDLEKRLALIENDIKLAKIGLTAFRWAVGVAIATGIIVLVERALG